MYIHLDFRYVIVDVNFTFYVIHVIRAISGFSPLLKFYHRKLFFCLFLANSVKTVKRLKQQNITVIGRLPLYSS